MNELLRSNIKKKRDALSHEQILSKSHDIISRLELLEEYRNARNILFYVSFRSEVDTSRAIANAFDLNKTILVPFLENQKMKISVLIDRNALRKNKYGIQEPVEKIPFDKEEIDLVIVPGTAFDMKGNRTGFGYGYYDEFLKDLNMTKIGLAYELQITREIETHKKDVPVDIVITEKRVIRCSD